MNNNSTNTFDKKYGTVSYDLEPCSFKNIALSRGTKYNRVIHMLATGPMA